MEFRSLEEFDRAFFASRGAAGDAFGTPGGDAYGAPGGEYIAAGDVYGAAPRGAFGGPPGTQLSHDPFLWDAAPPTIPPSGPRKQTPAQIVNTVVSYTIIALLAVGLLAFVAPIPFGVKMLNVKSGSMQPYYNVNTLVWVVPTKFEKIKKGDDVTYRLPAGQLSTHRVMSIDKSNRRLTVKGTYASEFEELIGYDQVQGVVKFHIHGIGKAMETLSGENGIYITIMLILAIVLLWGVTFVWGKMNPELLSKKRPLK